MIEKFFIFVVVLTTIPDVYPTDHVEPSATQARDKVKSRREETMRTESLALFRIKMRSATTKLRGRRTCHSISSDQSDEYYIRRSNTKDRVGLSWHRR